MKKLKGILILALLLAVLASPIAVLASDISGARYYGTIVVTSTNSSAVSNVSVNFTLSTPNLINVGYLNSSANNCVVRSSAGADLPFMPGVDATSPWCVRVPALGPNASTGDILYTAESTGGKIRYFPAAGGMTSSDNVNMELGDNFTVAQKGWVDTTLPGFVAEDFTTYTEVDANGKLTVIADTATAEDADQDEDVYLYKDQGANYFDALDIDFEIYMTGTSAQQARCGMAITNTVDSIFGFAATDISVAMYKDGGNVHNVILMRGAIAAVDTYAGAANTPYYCTLVRASGNDTVDVRVYTDTARTVLVDTLTLAGFGTTKYQYSFGFVNYKGGGAGNDFDGYVKDLGWTGTRYLVNKSGAFLTYVTATGNITSIMVGTAASVTAGGVSSGNHTVTTTANTTHMWIAIDGDTKDTIALAGATVPDTGADWYYYQNMADYWHYTKVTIDGVLQQHIEWEYDTVFSDLSGNSHDATPTFRTTSSNPSVSAVFTDFLPIAEAKAPPYVLTGAPPFIETTPTIVDVWGMTPPAGTFPMATVVASIAAASGTPAQLPLLIIAAFIIIGLSLGISGVMRQKGSGSVFVKVLVITAMMGVFIALGNFGVSFWMLVLFLILGLTICIASRQTSWN